MFGKLKLVLVMVITSMLASSAYAEESLNNAMQALKVEWAQVKYQTPKQDKVKKLEAIIEQVNQLSAQYPNEALPALWQGTMLSTLASLKGGLSALSSAKQAKNSLEASLSKDPQLENGYAHVILGALYSKVPGKPLGFGNKETAKRHFQTALKIDPQGLESNYFYGEFLMNEGKFAEAKQYLEIAQKSTANPDFQIFEVGRRQEIAAALQSVNQKLSS